MITTKAVYAVLANNAHEGTNLQIYGEEGINKGRAMALCAFNDAIKNSEFTPVVLARKTPKGVELLAWHGVFGPDLVDVVTAQAQNVLSKI